MQVFPSETRTARLPDGRVAALRPLDALAPWIEAWRALSRESAVDNVFFEPEFALAAAPTFGAGVNLLMVCDRPPEEPGVVLQALWPCRIVFRWGLPMPVLMGWTHGFSVFGAPLLHRGDPVGALRALIDAPRQLHLPRRLMLPYLPLDGVLAEAIAQVRSRGRSRRADFWAHRRGYLDLTAVSNSARAQHLQTRLSRDRQRQLARFRRRLEASGPVVHETVKDPRGLGDALDDYLALEASGWKGRLGTSADARPGERRFLHRLVEAYGEKGRMRIDRLRRNEHTLAASIAFETASTFWYFKISFAEDEARNSPGAQLIRSVTEDVLADGRFVACDSCAPPSFTLIDTFWGADRRLAHTMIEAGGGDLLFPIAVGLERVRTYAVGVRNRRRAGRCVGLAEPGGGR